MPAPMLVYARVTSSIPSCTEKCDHKKVYMVFGTGGLLMLDVSLKIHSVFLNYFNCKSILAKFWFHPHILVALSSTWDPISSEHSSSHAICREGT